MCPYLIHNATLRAARRSTHAATALIVRYHNQVPSMKRMNDIDGRVTWPAMSTRCWRAACGELYAVVMVLSSCVTRCSDAKTALSAHVY